MDSGLSDFPTTDQHLNAELLDRYTIALIASDYLVIVRHKTERYVYDKDGIVTGGLNQHSYGFITFDENIGVLSYFGLWGSNHKTNKGAFLGRVEGSYCTGEMIETEDGVLWYRREGAKPGRLESKWILRRDGKLAMYLYGVKYDGLPKEEWTLRFLLRRIQPGSSDSNRSTLKR